LAQTFYLSEGEQRLLMAADVGEGLFFAGQNHVAIRVIASPEEHVVITTNPAEMEQIQAAKQQQELMINQTTQAIQQLAQPQTQAAQAFTQTAPEQALGAPVAAQPMNQPTTMSPEQMQWQQQQQMAMAQPQPLVNQAGYPLNADPNQYPQYQQAPEMQQPPAQPVPSFQQPPMAQQPGTTMYPPATTNQPVYSPPPMAQPGVMATPAENYAQSTAEQTLPPPQMPPITPLQ
jgi:hypothetical protein